MAKVLRGSGSQLRAGVWRPVGALSVLAVAFGLAVSPLSSGPARADDACASPGTFGCFQITSADPKASGSVLDVEYLTDAHSFLKMLPDGRPSSDWQFQLNQDSSFQIRDLSTGNCIDVWQTTSDLDQWECQGQSSQNWYLEPFATGSATYRIRQVDTGECMALAAAPVLNHLLPVRLPREVKVEECGTDIAQAWNIGIAGTVPGLDDLAAQYASSGSAN